MSPAGGRSTSGPGPGGPAAPPGNRAAVPAIDPRASEADARPRPRVTVVVETENERFARRLTLHDCLQALARQTYPRALTEVIVVDSGEIAGLRALVQDCLPGARILDGAGLSEYEMKNAGARQASGEIVAYTDGDCVPAPEWIEQVVQTLGAAPARVVGVQGQEGKATRTLRKVGS